MVSSVNLVIIFIGIGGLAILAFLMFQVIGLERDINTAVGKLFGWV